MTAMQRQKLRSNLRKKFGHRNGRSSCAHSIGKFFLCYIVLFSFETSATGSPGNYLYFSPFLYLVFPLLFTHMNDLYFPHMKKSVVNPVTARCVGTIKVVALKGLRWRGWWNMTSWLDRVGMGPRFLLIGQHHISMWSLIQPSKNWVSNWKGFSSQGFWLIQKKDNWVLRCFLENTMATVMAILQSSFDQVSVWVKWVNDALCSKE